MSPIPLALEFRETRVLAICEQAACFMPNSRPSIITTKNTAVAKIVPSIAGVRMFSSRFFGGSCITPGARRLGTKRDRRERVHDDVDPQAVAEP